MKSYDIALIGGDARTAYMLPYLLERGYRVISYGLFRNTELEDLIEEAPTLEKAIGCARCIVGGIPFLKGDSVFRMEEAPDLQVNILYESLKKGQILFGGILSKTLLDVCSKKSVVCYDFMENEPYVIKNAIATAEGSILEALLQKDTNLHGSHTLILGYGRCGKVLAQKLKGLDAEVCVCSQSKEDLAYADTCGMKILEIGDLAKNIEDYEYIYNTIPAVVLSKEILKKVRKNALILDIASAPGGVDDEAAEEAGLKVLHCYGLPGKYAPRTSAEGLAEYVIQTIDRERGYQWS